MPDPQKPAVAPPSLDDLLGLSVDQRRMADDAMKNAKDAKTVESDTLTPWLKKEGPKLLPMLGGLALTPFTGGGSLLLDAALMGGGAAAGSLAESGIERGTIDTQALKDAAIEGGVNAAMGPLVKGASSLVRGGATRLLGGALKVTPAEAEFALQRGKGIVNRGNADAIRSASDAMAPPAPMRTAWSDEGLTLDPNAIQLTDAPRPIPTKIQVPTGAAPGPGPYERLADAYDHALSRGEGVLGREGVGTYVGREIAGKPGAVIGGVTTALSRPWPASVTAQGLFSLASTSPAAQAALARAAVLAALGHAQSSDGVAKQ